ncbi:Dam family site-specific DNA-(adenine-N6)-methyltransferase [Yersinia kristensenii]|uniref:Dam family site-specific DNA-(adenine-N6)-methyltransferase n=1 Tax=Yersinia kristensenii TaxID=28152 RepID=UPI0002E0D5C1|nr:Dam family site-specific DNA-(adenine-N6)-methyltransferase [Yersinia kristensenii]SUP70791.1 DNA adenine methylase [Yersinia kristensenii]
MELTRTVLKWAGSKAGIMAKLRPHLPITARLVEPFAGSCSVMMNTDYPAYLIADANPDLIGLYQVLKERPDEFIHMARSLFITANTAEQYYAIRQMFNSSINSCPLFRAVIFFYLNRHCYNGLCRYNQSGKFNTPYGKYKKPYFPEAEIRAFAAKAKRATFICASFEESLDMVQPGDGIYCDPPYLSADSHADEFTAYHSEKFGYDQHHLLAYKLRGLSARGFHVVASNNDNHLVRDLYHDFFKIPVTARRSCGGKADSRKSAEELILGRIPESLIWLGVDFADAVACE